MKRISITLAVAGLVLLLVSCASKKAAVQNDVVSQKPSATSGNSGKPGTSGTSGSTAKTDAYLLTAAYLKKVTDQRVAAKNVVSNMTFNIKMGDKDITVPGSVHMRRDEVIRLQLFIPLLGTEVGRIEFSPNRVLVVDRMHKEYIEADYTQLDFLKNNGLNFYSLQALFWNQLMVPGQKDVSESDFSRFSLDGKNVKLANGSMTYNWTTSATGQIVMANASYASAKNGASSLLWMYSDFKPLGTKLFPAHQDFQFSTSSSKQLKSVKVTIDMENVKDKSDWEVKTTVSSKYKKVEATDVLGKLLRF